MPTLFRTHSRENTLLPTIMAVLRWAKRQPVAMPESPEEIRAHLLRLNRAEKWMLKLEIDIDVAWYVNHRAKQIRQIECLKKFVFSPATPVDLQYAWHEGHSYDPSKFSPESYVSMLFNQVNIRVFQHHHRNPQRRDTPEKPYYPGALEFIPTDYRFDILGRLITETRRLRNLMKKIEKHARLHEEFQGTRSKSIMCKGIDKPYITDTRINPGECREIVELWMSGPATYGRSASNLVQELVDASRRLLRSRLPQLVSPAKYGEPKSVGENVRNGAQAGNQKKTKKAESKKEAVIAELMRRHGDSPNTRKTSILKAMAKERIGGKLRWGSLTSLWTYCKYIEFDTAAQTESAAE